MRLIKAGVGRKTETLYWRCEDMCELRPEGVLRNYTEGVISGSEKRGTVVQGMWCIREGGRGSECIICEFCLPSVRYCWEMRKQEKMKKKVCLCICLSGTSFPPWWRVWRWRLLLCISCWATELVQNCFIPVRKKTNSSRLVFISFSRKLIGECLPQGCSKGTVTPNDIEK